MASNDEVLASLRGRPRGEIRFRNSAYMPTDYMERIAPKFDEQGFRRIEDLLSGASYDQSGLQAFKERALQTGESPWARMMREKTDMEQGKALSSAGAQAAGATSGAMSNLAMRGGLSRGAAERLARGGMRDMAQARQEIYGRGAGQRLDIGIEDEKQRLAALGALPGLQAQAYETQLRGVSPWMDLAGKRLDFEKDIFGQRMAGYGAEKTAEAISGAYGTRMPGATSVRPQRPNLLR